jgi:hypothetical protein
MLFQSIRKGKPSLMFLLKFGNEIKAVRKISADEFSPAHREIVSQVRYENGNLVFVAPEWASTYLGAGEEKAVFCVCDRENRVFALEVINQKTYLDGRFVGGVYFYETIAAGLSNVKLNPLSLLGLTFTGLVKAREYVHGYEWARFQFSPERHNWLDGFLTDWLRFIFAGQFYAYRAHYKDVHDRNVMFEIREANQKGVPVLAKDWSGKPGIVRVGIQPIDIR